MTQKKQETNELADMVKRVEEIVSNEVVYIPAGFNSRIPGLSVDSLSFKRRFDGNFQVVIRATKDRGTPASVRVVAFTQGATFPEVFGLVEGALAYSKLKWSVDRYAEERAAEGTDAGTDQGLVKLKPVK